MYAILGIFFGIVSILGSGIFFIYIIDVIDASHQSGGEIVIIYIFFTAILCDIVAYKLLQKKKSFLVGSLVGLISGYLLLGLYVFAKYGLGF